MPSNQQSYLNQIRTNAGYGVQNVRDSSSRSNDQNQTQSGNPSMPYNYSPSNTNMGFQNPNLGRYTPPTMDSQGNWQNQSGYAYNLPSNSGPYFGAFGSGNEGFFPEMPNYQDQYTAYQNGMQAQNYFNQPVGQAPGGNTTQVNPVNSGNQQRGSQQQAWLQLLAQLQQRGGLGGTQQGPYGKQPQDMRPNGPVMPDMPRGGGIQQSSGQPPMLPAGQNMPNIPNAQWYQGSPNNYQGPQRPDMQAAPVQTANQQGPVMPAFLRMGY